MDPTMIATMIAGAGAAGIGASVGLRMLPIALQANRELRLHKNNAVANAEQLAAELENHRRRLLSKPAGSKRTSSIIGMYRDAIRHKNGEYTRLYDFPLQPTMLADDRIAERRCNELGRLLALPLPAGTLAQFRYTVGPDPGGAIAEHLRTRNYERTYPPATRLHDTNVDFYKGLADAHAFRHERATLVLRLPVKHEEDESTQGANSFFPEAARAIKREGLSSIFGAVADARRCTSKDGVVRRLLENEQATFERAEKLFRRFQMQSPLPLRRYSQEETWRTLIKGHVLNARSVPRMPITPGFDISDYLNGETIEDRG